MLQQAEAIDRVLHALADPNRRLMVERLSRGPTTVSDLAAPFAISLAAVGQHLQILEASGIVRSHKHGRVRTCEIDAAALDTVDRWIRDRQLTWERRLDRLGALLAEPPTASADGVSDPRSIP